MPRIVLALLVIAVGACTSPGPIGEGPHRVPGLDGKADNYVSSNAREFELSGFGHAVLPPDLEGLGAEERQAALRQAVDTRLSTVNRSIKTHVANVLREANGETSGEDARFFTYFKSDASDAGTHELTEDGRIRFSFEIGLVGSYYLMSQLAPGDADRRTFQVEIADWTGDVSETIEVEIEGSESRDAFPRYAELFADGVYDLAVHFGGDYNEGRYDLETARWLVEMLLEGGWQNPEVSRFEDLTLESPPFTQRITVEGRELETRVYVYHSEMADAEHAADLRAAMERSFAERDVVIYSGHAGPGAGFLLDYHPRYELPARDFATMPMADKYQIIVLDGCQTYRSYVDDLMANPAKTFSNVDIVTTVNTTPFSVGYQTIHEFVYWLTITGEDGRHFPVSWLSILRGVNTRDFRSVHYGVHGVDQDPQLNPHGGEEAAAAMCQPCQSDADCGPGGNFCLALGEDGGRCGVACTTDTACGEGFRCARLFDLEDEFYLPKQCIPRDYTCG